MLESISDLEKNYSELDKILNSVKNKNYNYWKIYFFILLFIFIICIILFLLFYFKKIFI